LSTYLANVTRVSFTHQLVLHQPHQNQVKPPLKTRYLVQKWRVNLSPCLQKFTIFQVQPISTLINKKGQNYIFFLKKKSGKWRW
jgi:hypothetical protein